MYKITLTEQAFETIQKKMFSYPDSNVRKK